MKFSLIVFSLSIFAFKSSAQTMTYADTISTPIGDFMLETNEEPSGSVSFDHQTQTSADGGTVDLVNFSPSSERKMSSLSNENISFSIIPNPTKETANLQVKDGGIDLIVQILDVSGREISTKNYSSSDGNYLNVLDLSQYDSGIYFIDISTGGYHYSRKLIKQ